MLYCVTCYTVSRVILCYVLYRVTCYTVSNVILCHMLYCVSRYTVSHVILYHIVILCLVIYCVLCYTVQLYHVTCYTVLNHKMARVRPVYILILRHVTCVSRACQMSRVTCCGGDMSRYSVCQFLLRQPLNLIT